MKIDDNNLIKEYLNGDEEAFEVLVQQYLKLIYNFVYRKINNVTEAEDITQEVFLKVWRNLKRFDQNKKFKSWIFTIAKNTIFDHLRRSRSAFGGKKTLSFSNFQDENGNNLLENKLIAKEIISENNLAYVVKKLSPQHQEIISLHNDHDFTFREIAKTLNAPINTVKSNYYRAIAELRKII